MIDEGITISINSVRHANVTLQVGQIAETIAVESAVAVLEMTKADVSVNLESKAVTTLPLRNYRN